MATPAALPKRQRQPRHPPRNHIATTGNSASQSAFDLGNAIIRLDARLNLADYFAPSNWAALNAGDTDLGSLGPVLLPNGRVLAVGKDGIAYLADAGDLGHVGNQLASLKVGAPYGTIMNS